MPAARVEGKARFAISLAFGARRRPWL